jgi:hypothetical protein
MEENQNKLWGKGMLGTGVVQAAEEKKIISEMQENIFNRKNCEYLLNNKFLLKYSYRISYNTSEKEEVLDIYDLDNKTLFSILVHRTKEEIARRIFYFTDKTYSPSLLTKRINPYVTYLFFDIYFLDIRKNSVEVADIAKDRDTIRFVSKYPEFKKYLDAALQKSSNKYDDI